MAQRHRRVQQTISTHRAAVYSQSAVRWSDDQRGRGVFSAPSIHPCLLCCCRAPSPEEECSLPRNQVTRPTILHGNCPNNAKSQIRASPQQHLVHRIGHPLTREIPQDFCAHDGYGSRKQHRDGGAANRERPLKGVSSECHFNTAHDWAEPPIK
jgi:hypothetical protein